MQHINKQKVWLEIISWVVTGFLCFLVLFPILQKTNRYPFTTINVIFIIVFITLFRYIFLLKYTWVARLQYVKITLVFLSIPLIFNMIGNLNFFITHLDEFSTQNYFGHLEIATRENLEIYMRTEMILFGVGSIISSIIFPFRMIISAWRFHNKGTV